MFILHPFLSGRGEAHAHSQSIQTTSMVSVIDEGGCGIRTELDWNLMGFVLSGGGVFLEGALHSFAKGDIGSICIIWSKGLTTSQNKI